VEVPVALADAVAEPLPVLVELGDAVTVTLAEAVELGVGVLDSLLLAVPVGVGEPVGVNVRDSVGVDVAVPDGDSVDVADLVPVVVPVPVPLPLGVLVVVKVAVRDAVVVALGVASNDSHVVSQRTTRTKLAAVWEMKTSTLPSPVELSAVKPKGSLTVALIALPPLPVVEHVPVPANACTTRSGYVMRRTRQAAVSATRIDWSGMMARPRGLLKLASDAGRPLPADTAVPVPVSVVMMRVSSASRRTRSLSLSAISRALPPGQYTIMTGSSSCALVPAPPSPLKPAVPPELTHTVSVRLDASEAFTK